MRSALRTEESKARAVGRSVADVGQDAGALGQCRAVVVFCIDYRFVEPLRRFLADHRPDRHRRPDRLARGAAALTTPDHDVLVNAMGLAFELHDPADPARRPPRLRSPRRLACFPGRQAEIATLDTSLAMAPEIVVDRFPAGRPREPVLVRASADGAART